MDGWMDGRKKIAIYDRKKKREERRGGRRKKKETNPPRVTSYTAFFYN
jgi:hypothetical protein